MQLNQGKVFREFILERVRQARQEILIRAYRLEFDAFGQALIAELEYACQRGLQVRCLLDGYGSRAFIREHPSLIRNLEMEFHVYRPLTWPLICFETRHLAPMRRLDKLLPRLQKRDTTNSLVFDRLIAVSGDCDLIWESTDKTVVSKVMEGMGARKQAEKIDDIWNNNSTSTLG